MRERRELYEVGKNNLRERKRERKGRMTARRKEKDGHGMRGGKGRRQAEGRSDRCASEKGGT